MLAPWPGEVKPPSPCSSPMTVMTVCKVHQSVTVMKTGKTHLLCQHNSDGNSICLLLNYDKWHIINHLREWYTIIILDSFFHVDSDIEMAILNVPSHIECITQRWQYNYNTRHDRLDDFNKYNLSTVGAMMRSYIYRFLQFREIAPKLSNSGCLPVPRFNIR